MQPNHNVTGTDFTVNGRPFGVAVKATGCEAKRSDEKIMFSRNVLADENWNESFNFGGARFHVLQKSRICNSCEGDFRKKRSSRISAMD